MVWLRKFKILLPGIVSLQLLSSAAWAVDLRPTVEFCRKALKTSASSSSALIRKAKALATSATTKATSIYQNSKPIDPRTSDSFDRLMEIADRDGPQAARKEFFRMIQGLNPRSSAIEANLTVLKILKPNNLSEGYFLLGRLQAFKDAMQSENQKTTVVDYALYSVLTNRESRDGVLNQALPMDESQLKRFSRLRRATKWYVVLPTLAITASMLKLAFVAGYGTPLVSSFNQRPNAVLFGATTKAGFSFWGHFLQAPENHPQKEVLDDQAKVLERMQQLSEGASKGIIDSDQAWADFQALVKVFPKIYGSGGEQLGSSESWGQAMINDAYQNAFAAIDAYSNKKDQLHQTQDILDVGMLHGAPLTPEKRKELEMRVYMLKREIGLNIARKEAIRTIYPFVEEHHKGVDRFAVAMGEPELVKLVGGKDIVMQLYMEAFAEVYNIQMAPR